MQHWLFWAGIVNVTVPIAVAGLGLLSFRAARTLPPLKRTALGWYAAGVVMPLAASAVSAAAMFITSPAAHLACSVTATAFLCLTILAIAITALRLHRGV